MHAERGLLLALLLGLAAISPAAGLSDIKGKDLSGADFDLYQTAAKKPTLVMVGFTKAAGDRCKAWGDALWADAGTDTRVALVSLVMLNRAPSLVRPFIRHAIRSHTPAARWSSGIIVVDDVSAWEAHFASDLKADPDQCFVFFISSDGTTACETAGVFDAASMKALKDCEAGHAH